MKKVISLLLSVLMIFSLVSSGVSAAEKNELKLTVVNDLHYNIPYGNYKGTAYNTEDYSHVSGNGQLWIEANLIIDTFFAEIAQNDSDIVLIPGDLTDHGTVEEHEAFSQVLADFETTSDKRVYVVPGNHDYYKTDKINPSVFADFYADFGYNEAIARDSDSASYVVDLDSEYRLLAIDSCLPGEGGAGIDENRKEWIEDQAKQAQKDGKKLISMMHHNLLNHFIFGDMLHPDSFVSSKVGLPELYAQYNIKYNFTGHTHSHDIKAYTGKNGVTVYDVLTSSLNLYPLPYRTVILGEEIKIKTEKIESVDVSSKQGIISDNCYALAASDFQAYALACARHGLSEVIDSYSSPDNIKNLLKLDNTKDEEVCDVIDKVFPRLVELLDTPMYAADSQGGPSIESYAKQLSLDLPETDIKNIREMAIFFYQQYVEGDENYGIFSAEYVLLTAALTVFFNQLLAEVSAEDYANLLNYLVTYLNLRSINSLNAYAGDAVSRIKGIDIFVSALGSSVLLTFTTDELPDDNNVSLPGYEVPVIAEEELSLFDRIVKFFLSFFDKLLRFFGIGE